MANHGIDEQNIVDAISVFLCEPNINFQREACGIFAELTRVSNYYFIKVFHFKA